MRLEAAERFARGEKAEAVARELRVTSRSVRRWRRVWEEGGADAQRSKGPASVERLSAGQRERLECELKRDPLAHGWDDEFQGWMLKRVKLLIGRMFHAGFTIQGVWKLVRRNRACRNARSSAASNATSPARSTVRSSRRRPLLPGLLPLDAT
ncbi:helix-turn-helix domain-containing protein [Streptomyces sp. NPDC001852]|uniref:helix-turn-helix domain-containing protein n=1 Tax=Streptomyces sp. NPDC001852 TaxID=3364619 RepID=UPI003696A8D4